MGQAMAEAFAEEGANVAITYLHDQKGAEETRKKVEAAGRRAIVVHFDQRKPEEVERLFRETEEKLGTPYILVNDAGIDSTGKHVADMLLEDWDDEMKTNIYGPFYCCQHFIRARKAQGGQGKIINITSVHQEIPRAGAAGYDVAKGGTAQSDPDALPRTGAGPYQRQQHRAGHGADTVQSAGDRRSESAGEAGAEHPVETRGRAVGDRQARGLSRVRGRGLCDRPDLHNRWRAVDECRPGRLRSRLSIPESLLVSSLGLGRGWEQTRLSI